MSVLTKVFDPKHPNEIVPLSFDFSALPGAIIAGASSPLLAVTHLEGAADPSDPADMLVGSPQIIGGQIRQKVRAGVDGATYLFRCEIDTDAGLRWVLNGTLDVRSL